MQLGGSGLTPACFVLLPQNFVIKTLIFSYLWSIYDACLHEMTPSPWFEFWKVAFPIINIVLFGAQMYAVCFFLPV